MWTDWLLTITQGKKRKLHYNEHYQSYPINTIEGNPILQKDNKNKTNKGSFGVLHRIVCRGCLQHTYKEGCFFHSQILWILVEKPPGGGFNAEDVLLEKHPEETLQIDSVMLVKPNILCSD
jgi:hypothetical protein